MAFRSNPRPKFMGPSPWLQGAPPSALLPNPMQAQGSLMNQGPRQNVGYNPIVSQLALANNLLTSALNKNQSGFGTAGGRGLLGSAPQPFHSPGPGAPGMMRNMMLQSGPDPKRMRMGPGSQGVPPFNQRPRLPFNSTSRPQNRGNREQSSPLFRDRNQPKPILKRSRWEEEKNKKLKEIPTDKTTSKADTAKEKDAEEIVVSSGDEKTYDPSSPTSDVEAKDNEEETNNLHASREVGSSDNKDGDEQGILQVTIQKGMKGRSVCKEGESGAVSQGPMFCHVCNVSCLNLENFQKHMNSKSHKVKMDSLITLHEAKTKQLEARMKASDQLRKLEEKERGKASFCNICKSSYTGSAILHKRTSEHKKQKELTSTFCRQCNIKNFNNPQEREEHYKTEEHVKALEEWKNRHGNNEAGDDEDSDEAEGDKAPDAKADSSENFIKTRQAGPSQSSFASTKKNVPILGSDNKNSVPAQTAAELMGNLSTIPPFNPDRAIGLSHVVPLSGLFCKLCRKFYKDEESAERHCQSKMHYDNYKKSLAAAANFQKLKEKRDSERNQEKETKSAEQSPSKQDEKKASHDKDEKPSNEAASKPDEAAAEPLSKEEPQTGDEAEVLSKEPDLTKDDDDAPEAQKESDELPGGKNTKDADNGDKCSEPTENVNSGKDKKEAVSSPTSANAVKSKNVAKKTPQRGRGRGKK